LPADGGDDGDGGRAGGVVRDADWRAYRRTLEWRCRWVEVRMAELREQERRYARLDAKLRAREAAAAEAAAAPQQPGAEGEQARRPQSAAMALWRAKTREKRQLTHPIAARSRRRSSPRCARTRACTTAAGASGARRATRPPWPRFWRRCGSSPRRLCFCRPRLQAKTAAATATWRPQRSSTPPQPCTAASMSCFQA
jgi:hypothetical protein